MNGSAWVGLVQRIPEAQHDNLVVVTGTGAEIMVQKILVLEEAFMIFRGRPAGSTEVPRILLIPFDQINHLAFQKPLPEAEIKTMFSGETPAPEAKAAPAAAVEPISETPIAAPPPPESPVAPPPADPSARAAPPSKSILLARLRARLQKG